MMHLKYMLTNLKYTTVNFIYYFCVLRVEVMQMYDMYILAKAKIEDYRKAGARKKF